MFEGYSWNVSRLELNKRRREGESLWTTMRRSKDPAVYTILVEDSAALIGISVALFIDPAASIVIGLVLVAAAIESRSWRGVALQLGHLS